MRILRERPATAGPNADPALLDELPDALGDPDADLHPSKTGAMHFREGTARNRQSLGSSVANLVRRCQDPLGRDDTSRSPPGRPTPGTSRRYRETEGSLPTMTQ